MRWHFKRSMAIKKDVSLPTGSIKLIFLIELAFKNLFSKKLRAFLTMTGVLVGVGAVIFLLAFGLGLRQVVTDQVVDSDSIRTIDVLPAKAQIVKLTDESIKRIERTSGVETVAPIYYYAGKTELNGAKVESVVYGVNNTYSSLVRFKRIAGVQPQFSDDHTMVVNSAYVEALGFKNPQQVLGKELKISLAVRVPTENGDEKKVITYAAAVRSVIESGSGAEMYISSKIFSENGVDVASQLKVLSEDKKYVEAIQRKVETLGFTSTSPLQTLEQINQFFVILNLLFVGFGGIGLLIATLGMFNTLTVSLLERTKEIGLMVALGARRRDVRRLFVVESVSLALLGGVLGVIGSGAISVVVNTVLQRLSRSRGVEDAFSLFSYPWWLQVAVLIFSVVLGLIVVILPARRASRINPIEALKI